MSVSEFMLWALAAYVVAMNVVTFCVFGADKLCAKRGWRRVPEKTLFILAAIGGSIGSTLGMSTWHHKTLHNSFRFGIPAILIAHIAIVVGVLWLVYGRR